VEAIKSGTSAVLSCRAAARYDAPALKAAEKLLKVVPEVRVPYSLRPHGRWSHSSVCNDNKMHTAQDTTAMITLTITAEQLSLG
jgi:hypothetical protein